MSALRPATLNEYVTWLRAWIHAGNEPTHAYDYPWSRQTWLTATRDFRLGGERGADSVHILAPAGVHHAGGALGHNQLYFTDGPGQRGGVIPVFADEVFQSLPGVREFIREEERRRAVWLQEVEERHAAEGSDVGRWAALHGAGPVRPDEEPT